MANIKNMPSFYLDDDQNENFPSEREVVKKPPLTPSFIVNGEITLKDCQKEVDRIIKNIDSMEDYDVITNAQKNIMYNILKSISPYTLSDLGHLPKEEQDAIIKETALKLREFYHSNLTPDKLYKDISSRKNNLNSVERNERIDSSDELDDAALSILANIIMEYFERNNIDNPLSKEDIKKILEKITTEPDKDLSEMPFNEAIKEDVIYSSYAAIREKVYGQDKLGKDIKYPLDPELIDIKCCIKSIDIDTGDLYLTFYDAAGEILDYENFLNIDKQFKTFLAKWKIEPCQDSFIFAKENDNLIDQFGTDPISELSKKFNITFFDKVREMIMSLENEASFGDLFKDKMDDMKLINDMLAATAEYVSPEEFEELMSSISKDFRHNEKDDEQLEDSYELLNRLSENSNASLITSSLGNENNRLDQLFDKENVGKVGVNVAYPVKILCDEIGQIFLFDEILKRVSFENFWPKNKELFEQLKDLKKCVIDLDDCINAKNFTAIPLEYTKDNQNCFFNVGVGIYNENGKNVYKLFTHRFGNRLSKNGKILMGVGTELDTCLNSEFIAGLELLVYQESKDIKLCDLGHGKIFVTKNTLDNNESPIYTMIGKFFFNNSEITKEFKSKNNIPESVTDLPLYFSSAYLDKDERGTLISILFGTAYDSTDAFKNSSPVVVLNLDGSQGLCLDLYMNDVIETTLEYDESDDLSDNDEEDEEDDF